MYPYDKDNLLRKISIKILLFPLLKTKLSANTITMLNFLLLGLGSLILFFYDLEYWALSVIILMAGIDYCDGTIARIKNEVSKKGQYLDTSLDWLYLMLLIGVISYRHQIMIWGYICLIALTFGNWVQYNGNVNIRLPWFLGIIPILLIGILFKRADISILVTAIIQSIRTGKMYLWSIRKK